MVAAKSPASPYLLRYACVCDRGLRRSANQDRAFADLDHRVFAVCDGVGGSQGGEIASQTAIETLQDAFQAPDNSPPPVRLERAVHYANRDIFEMAARDVHLAGMATTIVVAYLDGLTAHIGHAGDSRLYRFQDGLLTQETMDHSDVQDAVRRGELTPKEALTARGKNIITRALGIQPEVELETRSFQFQVGTRFLLCTDGITRHLSNTELTELMVRFPDPQALCDELHRMCYSRGAEDNLTALVVCVDPNSDSAYTLPPNTTASPSFEAARTLEPQPIEDLSGEFRRTREHSIPPRSFPPERTSGKLHPLEEHLAAQQSAFKRRLAAGAVLGVLLLVGVFWAGGRHYPSVARSLGIAADMPSDGLETPPTNTDLFNAAGRDMLKNDSRAAREKLLKLVEREPNRAEYRLWLGRTCLAERKSAEATAQLEAAIQLNPKMAEAWLYLAAARRAGGDAAGAEAAFKKYVEVYGQGAQPSSHAQTGNGN